MSRSSAARSVASCFDMPRTVIGASMQFCSAVMCGKRLNDWNTMPIFDRTRRTWAGVAGTRLPFRSMWVSGSPSTQITPSLIDSSVISIRSTVVLPEPEGPMIETFSPRAMSRQRSSSTVSAP